MRRSQLSVSLILIALIVASLVLVTVARFSKAEVGTVVNSVISQDTTWTSANNPYTFNGPVLVSGGATLAVQPGVVVNMGENALEVNGTLVAIGTNQNNIQFNNGGIDFLPTSNGWNNQSNSGSIIQNADIILTPNNIVNNGVLGGQLTQIALQSPAEVNNDTLTSDPEMDDVIVATCGTISNNIIEGFLTGGLLYDILCSGNASVINNVITEGGTAGIYVGSGSPLIEGNLIYGNYFSGIMISNSATGTVVNDTPLIEDNTIVGNGAGLYLSTYSSSGTIAPTVTNNNIYNNSKYNYQLNVVSYDLSATDNWWGTTNARIINQTIYDFKDDFNDGNVTFIPFLSAPSTQAPTFVNATAGTGGSISPNGIVKLNYDSSQTFTVTPNNGYHIADVLVNGASVGAVSSYTVQNIQGATTISATFSSNPTPTPSPTPSPNSTISPASSSSPTATPTASPTVSPSPTSTTSSSSQFTVLEFPSLWVILTVFIAVSLSIAALIKVRKSKIIKAQTQKM